MPSTLQPRLLCPPAAKAAQQSAAVASARRLGGCARGLQAQAEADLLEMRREASRRQLEAAKKEREAAEARTSALAEQAAVAKQAQARAYRERVERLKAAWKDDKATSKARNARLSGMSHFARLCYGGNARPSARACSQDTCTVVECSLL